MRPEESRSDADLVEAARAGSQQAFGALVERYQNLVSSVAFALANSWGESEEIAQEAFVIAWRRLPEFRPPRHFRGWLCGITRNVHRHHRRQARRWQSDQGGMPVRGAEIAAAEPSALDRLISDEEERMLRRALAELPESYRLALVLYYREQQRIDDVAQSLDISVTTATKRIFLGRKLLHEHVSALEPILVRPCPRKGLVAAVLAAISAADAAPANSAPQTSASPAWTRLRKAILVGGAAAVLALPFLGLHLRKEARKSQVAQFSASLPVPPASPTSTSWDHSLGEMAPAAPEGLGKTGAQQIIDLDFEDGVLPDIVTRGDLTTSAGRPGNRHCLLAGLALNGGVRYIATLGGDHDGVLFPYSRDIVISFDYWVGDDAYAPPTVVVMVRSMGKQRNYYTNVSATTEVWAHADLRLADILTISRRGADDREVVYPLDEEDLINALSFSAGRPGGKPFYVDNIRVHL